MRDDRASEEFNSEYWNNFNNEVHDAVDKGKGTINMQDKPTEVLRYQQKVAEFKRLYYQWYYPLTTFGVSIIFALTVNRLIDFFWKESSSPTYPPLIIISIVIVIMLGPFLVWLYIYIYIKNLVHVIVFL